VQHIGDLIVDGEHETTAQVTGTTYVRSGGRLVVNGQLSGGLIIEPGGSAVVNGQVSRNVINHGTLALNGQVSGRVIGNPPINSTRPEQIVGMDLEVPVRGTTISWTSSH
jgi:hypothetical protein